MSNSGKGEKGIVRGIYGFEIIIDEEFAYDLTFDLLNQFVFNQGVMPQTVSSIMGVAQDENDLVEDETEFQDWYPTELSRMFEKAVSLILKRSTHNISLRYISSCGWDGLVGDTGVRSMLFILYTPSTIAPKGVGEDVSVYSEFGMNRHQILDPPVGVKQVIVRVSQRLGMSIEGRNEGIGYHIVIDNLGDKVVNAIQPTVGNEREAVSVEQHHIEMERRFILIGLPREVEGFPIDLTSNTRETVDVVVEM